MIYPTHTLLGSNVLPYSTGGTSLSPSTAAAATAAHYANAAAAYDFTNQYNQSQLDPTNGGANFPYGTSPAVAAAAAAAAAAASNQANVANYAYAALAQQAIPSLTAAYQQ